MRKHKKPICNYPPRIKQPGSAVPCEMIFENDCYITKILIPSTIEKFQEKTEMNKSKRKKKGRKNRNSNLSAMAQMTSKLLGINSPSKRGFKIVTEPGVSF